MIVFHLSHKFIGKECIFNPKIPENRVENENDSVKRICVSNSKEGCILLKSGLYYGELIVNGLSSGRIPRYHDHFYFCDIEEDQIYYPSESEVPDCVIHGLDRREIWLLKPTKMYYIGKTSKKLWPEIINE